jgi:hypothetical protein
MVTTGTKPNARGMSIMLTPREGKVKFIIIWFE